VVQVFPVGGGAGPAGGRGLLRGVGGLVRPQVHGPVGDREAVGARGGAIPGPDGRAAEKGEGEDRGAVGT
jgi:hypothetical protein